MNIHRPCAASTNIHRPRAAAVRRRLPPGTLSVGVASRSSLLGRNSSMSVFSAGGGGMVASSLIPVPKRRFNICAVLPMLTLMVA
eukprot:7391950-Prymnesium_polylepis.2